MRTYGCSFPCSIYTVNACNAFMEHQEYISEIEDQFAQLYNSNVKNSDNPSHWYVQLKYSHIFPMLHQHSIFLTTIGLLEYLLLGLCEQCRNDFKIKDEVPKNPTIKTIFPFLVKKIGLDLTDLSNEVSYFNNCTFIRNAIAHRAGVIQRTNDTKAFLYLTQNHDLSLNRQGTIKLSHAFLKEFVQKCRTLFISLDEVIDKRIIEIYRQYNHLPPEKQVALIKKYA